MEWSRLGRAWGVTAGLVVAVALGLWAVVRSGAPASLVGAGVFGLVVLAVASWRSGARFEAAAHRGRPLSGRDPPAIRHALLGACEATGARPPAVVVAVLDAPGVQVGYDRGRAIVVVDPLLPSIVGPAGLRALFVHELRHLDTDIHTDAVREYLPQVLGFVACWLVVLAGRGPAIAAAGSALYLGLAPVDHRAARAVRWPLGLGVEPLALAASRYANRQEEYVADARAAESVSPALLTEALYRVAAIATGDNDEDVAGPVPWEDDRTISYALFATHPSIEARAAALGCSIPDWVRPHRPGR